MEDRDGRLVILRAVLMVVMTLLSRKRALWNQQALKLWVGPAAQLQGVKLDRPIWLLATNG